MADGLTSLAEVAQVPMANTAIIKEDTRPLDAYFKAAENQYRNKVFNYQQKKDEIDSRVKALDFSTAGTWDRDLPDVNKLVGQGIDYVSENPDSMSPTKDNMDKYLSQRKIFNDVQYLATKSKADKAQYDLWKQKIVTDPDLKEHAPEYLQQLDAWANNKVQDRGDFALVPQLDDNAQHDALLMDNAAVAKDEQIGTVKSIGGGLEAVPVTTPVDMAGAEKVAQYLWQTSKTKRTLATEQWDNLPPELKAQYPAPYDWFLETRKSLMKVQPTTKNTIRDIPKPASEGSGTKITAPDIQQRKELIYKIQQKDPAALDILRGLKYGGVPPASVHYENTGQADSPTAVIIKTQPTSTEEGKTVRIEISDKTGGGFLALNQLINDLEGQKKISVEDLNKESSYNPKATQKTYSYNGKTVKQSDVEAAAKASGLTLEEYIKQAGLK